MKVDFLSDLHIDFYFNPKEKIKDEKIKKLYHPIITENNREIGDVLIVAGDIGHYNHQNIKVLKYLKEHYYKHVICVLGNHDYYLFDKDSKIQFKDSFERAEQMRLRINREENMYCLNGDFAQIDGVVFGGCDSWYNDGYFARQYPTQNFPTKSTNQQWKKMMYDGEMIIGVENFDDIWHIEKPKIEAVYEQCDVMITHISPSCKDEHFSPRFQNSPSNIFFSFEGEKYLKDGFMKYWVFGHTHEELEYEEHGVHCLCNPFGYPSESGNGEWIVMQSFEIEKKKLTMKEFSPMLLLTVNNSIGNKNNHFTVEELVNLFDKKQKDFTNRDKYAVDVIQTEADAFEINDFMEEHKISKEKVNYILSCKPFD